MRWSTAQTPRAFRRARAAKDRPAPPPEEWTARSVARALEPERSRELHRLTEHLLPVVHARVARVVVASPVPAECLRAEVEDLTQEVFAHLFENGAKVLRRWNPDRGASLRNYVGLVAERRVRSLLRSGRWTQWREQPAAVQTLESQASPVESPARRAAEQQCWERVLQRAEARLSSQGLLMMDLLLLQERPIAEVAERTGMTAGSLYAWRSRLQKLMRELARELRVADSPSVSP